MTYQAPTITGFQPLPSTRVALQISPPADIGENAFLGYRVVTDAGTFDVGKAEPAVLVGPFEMQSTQNISCFTLLPGNVVDTEESNTVTAAILRNAGWAPELVLRQRIAEILNAAEITDSYGTAARVAFDEWLRPTMYSRLEPLAEGGAVLIEVAPTVRGAEERASAVLTHVETET
jgi:hypothetical protein